MHTLKDTEVLKRPSGLSLPSLGVFVMFLLVLGKKNNAAAFHKVSVMDP